MKKYSVFLIFQFDLNIVNLFWIPSCLSEIFHVVVFAVCATVEDFVCSKKESYWGSCTTKTFSDDKQENLRFLRVFCEFLIFLPSGGGHRDRVLLVCL